MVSETFTHDDLITLGVVGNSVGLVEREEVLGLFHVKRRFEIINPLDSNTLTGRWTPPLDRKHIMNQVKSSQVEVTSEVAVYAIDVSTAATPIVFSYDVAANSFGLVFPITSPIFNTGVPPVMVFDSVRNQVILGHDFPSPFILPPRIGVVNLTTGKFTMTKGRGLGEINGMAVDSVDGVLCTTTSFDSAV